MLNNVYMVHDNIELSRESSFSYIFLRFLDLKRPNTFLYFFIKSAVSFLTSGAFLSRRSAASNILIISSTHRLSTVQPRLFLYLALSFSRIASGSASHLSFWYFLAAHPGQYLFPVLIIKMHLPQ